MQAGIKPEPQVTEWFALWRKAWKGKRSHWDVNECSIINTKLLAAKLNTECKSNLNQAKQDNGCIKQRGQPFYFPNY